MVARGQLSTYLCALFKNPRRGRQAINFTTNVPKILDLKLSSEQIFFPKIVVGCPCLLYILKVLLNLHNFPLLNINCTEPNLGPLYISYIMVQILNCKIPERVLLNGAIYM